MKKLFIVFILLLTLSISAEEIKLKDEGALLSVLYHQAASEYTALCYQAYNLATDRLLAIDAADYDKPLAVVLDVDETVLSNSRYNARNVLGIAEMKGGFNGWLDEMASEPIAGAYEFLQLADSLGIKIFYVTNRNERKQPETIGNLQKYDYPQVNKAQVLCKTKVSSKEPRRQMIAQNYEIVMLIGDNLIDFADIYGGRTLDERDMAVAVSRADFGRKFIILPNAMHGNWLKVINDFEYDLSEEELLQKRLRYLKY